MDLTSPEHDALVHLALAFRRADHQAAYDAIRKALSATDGERYTVETASPSVTFVVDRWGPPGRIVDSHDTARGAEMIASRLNVRNIGDGQRHLRSTDAQFSALSPSAASSDRDTPSCVFEISTEAGDVVATLPLPNSDEDHVTVARSALDSISAPTGWYGLSTAHGPTNPDHIDYAGPQS